MPETVRQQKRVGGELAEGVAGGAPAEGVSVGGRVVGEGLEDEVAGVAAAGGRRAVLRVT